MSSTSDGAGEVLRTSAAGVLVIRGGVLRTASYAGGALLAAGTAVFLLRGLGVDDFGRYAAVAALLAVVSTLSDAGLTAVGVRELSLLEAASERKALLGNLVALRLVLGTGAIAAAVVFALIAGYDHVMVEGVVLGGVGVLLVNTQATMIAPLSVELRIGRVALVELVRYVVTFALIAALSIVGSSLLPYFAVQVVVGLVVLAVTPLLLRSAQGMLPRLDRTAVRRLLRDAAPVGIALAMNVVYLRLLVLLVSLQTSHHETGLYGTAFRTIELFIGVPPLVIGVAIPVLAVAAAEDRRRLALGVQRLAEVSLVASLGVALCVSVVATPAVRLLGGANYAGAGPMLQIQTWALVPLAVGSVLSFALLALRRQASIAVANAAALVLVLLAGTLLVHLYEGVGAAITGVASEGVLTAALGILLYRADRSVVPTLAFVWRPVVALAAGAATLLVPLPSWIDAAVAGTVFLGASLALGALPPELVAALRRRAPGDLA